MYYFIFYCRKKTILKMGEIEKDHYSDLWDYGGLIDDRLLFSFSL